MDTIIFIVYTLAMGSILGYAGYLTKDQPKSFSPFKIPESIQFKYSATQRKAK